METYDIALTIHVIGAILWVGGGTYGVLMSHLAEKRGDAVSIRNFYSDAAWLGPRYFLTANVITIAAGVWATIEGPWSFGSTWISASLALFVVSFILGSALIGPQTDKIAKELVEGTPDEPAIRSRIDRVRNVQHIDLVVLYAIVVLMVFKP